MAIYLSECDMCQKACTGSAKEVPSKNYEARVIKGYPRSDSKADHAEVGGNMNKESQVW
jgi:hypothetical protein